MSTPSVWRTDGVDGGPLGLETLMVAVMLHEGSHVAQAATYGLRVTDLEQRYALPESFGDDSLQHRFGDDEDFSASIARETELFFAAAVEADDLAAHCSALEARELMRARADQWFSNEDDYWRDAEDIWLSFEGSGQWVAYRWLTDEHGAAMPASIAMPGFAQRSRWWSQNEGLAIVLTLDRLADFDWKRHAFGDGAKTILEMLDEALRDKPVRCPAKSASRASGQNHGRSSSVVPNLAFQGSDRNGSLVAHATGTSSSNDMPTYRMGRSALSTVTGMPPRI